MAKKNKSEVVIKESANHTDEFTEFELFIRKDKIGTIQQPQGKEITIITKDGKQGKAKSIDEAVNDLIMDYNLHYM